MPTVAISQPVAISSICMLCMPILVGVSLRQGHRTELVSFILQPDWKFLCKQMINCNALHILISNYEIYKASLIENFMQNFITLNSIPYH